jgi:hypothetical protein
MENPILIHEEQIDEQAFGDPRLIKRGRHCTMPSINIRLPISSLFFNEKLKSSKTHT